MQAKCFEVRDAGTLMPVLAVRFEASEPEEATRWLLDRAGYRGRPYVLLMPIEPGSGAGQTFEFDPPEWQLRKRPSATLAIAHEYIEAHFTQLAPGAVVDVEFLLGKRAAPKTSDRLRPLGRRS